MRAKEFIKENKRGDIPRAQKEASVGLHIYDDGHGWTSDYLQYRLGLALACADGKSIPQVDAQSWLGKRKSVHPYTDVEAKMLKHSFQAVGARWDDVHDGNLESLELKFVNTVSPVKEFKGYPR